MEDPILFRLYGRYCFQFLYDDNVQLFDEVIVFKDTVHPRPSYEDARDRFLDRPHADAIVRLAYSDHQTAWDAVLKVDLRNDSPEQRRARLRYERELLRNHLYLVRERLPTMKNEKEEGIHYVKILGSCCFRVVRR